jgi:hypothetical protein
MVSNYPSNSLNTGECFSLGRFLKIAEAAHICKRATFSHGKSYVFVMTKNGLGNILGDFFTNSSGANPTIAIYNASVVKSYNATNSIARFQNKNYFSILKNALAYYNADVVGVCIFKPGHPDWVAGRYSCSTSTPATPRCGS